VHAALERTPSLIIDCANIADTHHYTGWHDEQALHETYVLEIDLLYKFRDCIPHVQRFLPRNDIRFVAVTSFDHLFDYGDAVENKHVIDHAWERLARLTVPTVVDVPDTYRRIAEQYCEVTSWDTP
jgi:hypothetical protein